MISAVCTDLETILSKILYYSEGRPKKWIYIITLAPAYCSILTLEPPDIMTPRNTVYRTSIDPKPLKFKRNPTNKTYVTIGNKGEK